MGFVMRLEKKINKPTDDFELEAKNLGYKYIIGVDESGRGRLAGPVVAAAVCVFDGFDLYGVRDSKQLSSKKRELFYNKIIEECDYAISYVDEEVIDQINILNATKLAMGQCICKMEKADFVLIDGNFSVDYINVPQKSIVNGDNLSVSIALASILAKVTADRLILDIHNKWPIYAFNKHKGYGTQLHKDLIKLYGPCMHHRKSFAGVKEYCGGI